jgi:probable HAF family extracellular repeat protein
MQIIGEITRREHRKLIAGLGTLTLLCAGTGIAQIEDQDSGGRARYKVIDLGTLGGTSSSGWGINDQRWVSGVSSLPGDMQSRAFLWRKGVMTDLGTFGGMNSFSFFPLNNRGTVTGGAETSTPDPMGEDFCSFGTYLTCLPFVWRHGAMTALPTLGGGNGAAFKVNNMGDVVGEVENNSPDPTCVSPQLLGFQPVIWERGELHELPTLSGDPDGAALALNDDGEIVGWSGTCAPGYGPHETFFHALLWKHGTVRDLGNLGGSRNNVASDINNQGQIVGNSDLPGDTTTHAFLWWKGVMTDLGTLPGDLSSSPSGLNDNGQIVGASQDASGNSRAFVWQHGTMTDLNTLIPVNSPLFLIFGGSINSRAEITGVALLKGTTAFHAFLATPCGRDRVENHDCGDQIWDLPAVRGQTSEAPKVALPDAVRKLLQQRLRLGRSSSGVTTSR